jgi:hypothetical protein
VDLLSLCVGNDEESHDDDDDDDDDDDIEPVFGLLSISRKANTTSGNLSQLHWLIFFIQ